MNRRLPWVQGLASVGFFLLYVPLIILVINSFNAATRSNSTWAGFTLRWYVEAWQDDGLRSGLVNSLQFAGIAATLSLVLGTMVAFALRRFGPYRLRNLLAGLASLPLVMPEVVTGLMMLIFFVALRNLLPFWPPNGSLSVIVAHTTFGMAFAAVLIQARLADFDNAVVEAASDLGANPLDIFFSVTAPIILPALIAAWLLAFTLCFEDAVITQFVNGPGSTTLPVEIFSRVRRGIKPEVNALAAVMIAIVAVSLIAAMIIQAMTAKRK